MEKMMMATADLVEGVQFRRRLKQKEKRKEAERFLSQIHGIKVAFNCLSPSDPKHYTNDGESD